MQLYAYRNTERGAKMLHRPDPSIMELTLAKARNEAKIEADRIVSAAEEEAKRIINVAKAKAEAITAEAVDAATLVLGVAGLEQNDRLPVIDIIRAVANKHGVSIESIKGQCRGRHLVAIRHEAMALVYKNRPDLSLSVIGRIFNRDHTTILSAVRKSGVYLAVGQGNHR